MKKSLLFVGAASTMLAMFTTGCASGDDKMATISNHFNNPPERYCIPVKGKEAEAAALDKKLAETDVREIAALTKILVKRAILLEGRCKRLVPSPGECGAVATAAAVTIDTAGVVLEDLSFRSSSMGKAYLFVYEKSEALKFASRKMSESKSDVKAVVASLTEDQLRNLSSGTAAIAAVLDPKQTIVTLQTIAAESVKTVGELKKLIPTLAQRGTNLAETMTELSAKIASRTKEIKNDLSSKGVSLIQMPVELAKALKNDPVAVKVQKELDAIKKEVDCLKKEIKQAEILVEYGAYIGKSCGYMVQVIQETSALSQAARTALAQIENKNKNND